MSPSRFYVYLLLICFSPRGCSSGLLAGLLAGFSFASTLVGLTGDIFGFIDGGDSDHDQSLDTSKLVDQINYRIELGSETVYKRVNAQLQIIKIEDAVRNIENALTELKYFIEAISRRNEIGYYEKQFIESSKDAVKSARELTSLLDGSVSGFQNNILKYIAEQTCCDMSALIRFKTFYENLILNGMMVEFLVKKLDSYSDLESEKRFWNNEFHTLESNFSRQSNTCKYRRQTMCGNGDYGNSRSHGSSGSSSNSHYGRSSTNTHVAGAWIILLSTMVQWFLPAGLLRALTGFFHEESTFL